MGKTLRPIVIDSCVRAYVCVCVCVFATGGGGLASGHTGAARCFLLLAALSMRHSSLEVCVCLKVKLNHSAVFDGCVPTVNIPCHPYGMWSRQRLNLHHIAKFHYEILKNHT